jgi:PPK2 family polyphosphate:nucleotide phosphotransferase
MSMIKKLGVGDKFDLSAQRTDEVFGWDKASANERLVEVRRELAVLQLRLYAEGSRALLVVLQARDAAGKDGVVRHVMTGMNPAGVRVTSFKAPAGREAEQDFLWRCHSAAPGRGEVGVWNRSHYEDVLVVRVKGFVPEERWRKRFRHIREFERLLADEGTRIVKIHLNVSKDVQRERLQERIDDPEVNWKHNASDLVDRALWGDYTTAYQEAIDETDTSWAPWYVVPADKKWVRNLAVAELLLEVLRDMDPHVPPGDPALEGIVVE